MLVLDVAAHILLGRPAVLVIFTCGNRALPWPIHTVPRPDLDEFGVARGIAGDRGGFLSLTMLRFGLGARCGQWMVIQTPDLVKVGVARGLAEDLGEFGGVSALKLGVIEEFGRRRAYLPT